jgi:hypothetical protein
MTDDQRDILRMALEQMEEKKGLVWGPEWMEEVAAALRALLAEVADLKKRLDTAWGDNATNDRITDRLRAEVAQRTAERDALAAELAALKANDPLAEMWEALTEYQEQADKDGHGNTWRRMCEERTWDAARAAAKDKANGVPIAWAPTAAWAAQKAGNAVQEAVVAIAAIRRAKEAKP